MKRFFFASVLVASLALTGCFGFFEGDTNGQKPAADEAGVPAYSEQPSSDQPAPGQPPSFQDGDTYLKALQTRDTALCAKISNEELKTRCDAKVKKYIEMNGPAATGK